MDKAEFDSLDIGDLIRARCNGEVYVIVASNGNDTYIVNRTLTATNPSEWELIKRHRQTKEKELSDGVLEDMG